MPPSTEALIRRYQSFHREPAPRLVATRATPPPRPARRWRLRRMVVGLLVAGVLAVMFPPLVIVPFKLAFGWIFELDHHLRRGLGPPMLPAAVWWTLGAAALTKAVLWGLGRFLPEDSAESGSDRRSSQDGRRRPSGLGAMGLLAAVLAVVITGLTVTAVPVLQFSKVLGRIAGKLDAEGVSRFLSDGLDQSPLFRPYGRVTPRAEVSKAVNNARQLALGVRFFEQSQSGAMPSSLAELVEQGEIEAEMLPIFAEHPLVDPPAVMIAWEKLHIPGDLPLLVRPLPRHGGHVVSLVDGFTRFVPEEEWDDQLADWIPRLEAEGIEWPDFLR